MTECKYVFDKNADYLEAYLMARTQFKKIIKNFDRKKFKKNFDDLFNDEDTLQLFMYDDHVLKCGAICLTLEDVAFIDIFFWNQKEFATNKEEVRIFFDELFELATQKGIATLVVPMDTNRQRFQQFSKWVETLFHTNKDFVHTDPFIASQYKNERLLEVDIKKYKKTRNSPKP